MGHSSACTGTLVLSLQSKWEGPDSAIRPSSQLLWDIKKTGCIQKTNTAWGLAKGCPPYQVPELRRKCNGGCYDMCTGSMAPLGCSLERDYKITTSPFSGHGLDFFSPSPLVFKHLCNLGFRVGSLCPDPRYFYHFDF